MITLAQILSLAAVIREHTATLLARAARFHDTVNDAAKHVAKMAADYEPLRRQGKAAHDRMTRDIVTEWSRARELATGAALFDLEPQIERLAAAVETFMEARRRDVLLSMPDAFNHMSPAGMIQVAMLREMRRPVIDAMTAEEMATTYPRELARGDAAAFVNVELIEDRFAQRKGIAQTEEDLPAFRRLKFMIEEAQEDRLPSEELAEVAAILDAARKAVGRAKLLNVLPVNVEHDPVLRGIVERELAEVAG